MISNMVSEQVRPTAKAVDDKAGQRQLPVSRGSRLCKVQGHGRRPTATQHTAKPANPQQTPNKQTQIGTTRRNKAMQHTSHTERAANTHMGTYQKLRR